MSKIFNQTNLIVIFFIGLIVASFWLSQEEQELSNDFNLSSPAKILSAGEDANKGFKKATEIIEFEFPKDHASHEDFKSEWWYYTGNLESKDGKRFGYQVTIFRNALLNQKDFKAQSKFSKWQSNQVYMGHFALTDIDNNKFYSTERFSRDSLNLAGTNLKPKYKTWLNNWTIKSDLTAQKDIFPVLLDFDAKDYAIKLKLMPSKPITLQGDGGLSQKSYGEGNASYYYSITKLETIGEVSIRNKNSEPKTYEVSGNSWLDREWSSSSLSKDQIGWDWFALQLDNNVEIMYYQLRQDDGTASPYSRGTIVDAQGEKFDFNLNDVKLKVLDTFKSPYNGSVYPIAWQFKIPKIKVDIKIRPYVRNQEHNNSYPYYEGAVEVQGKFADKSIRGKGYLELVGYES